MLLRPSLSALACALLASISLGTAAPDRDALQELERLSSTQAAERESAQRWLAVHLGPADQRAVADIARRGDAETQRRLVRALAGDGRHLELIVRLCDDTGEAARELGREALSQLALAWLPGLADPPLRAEDVARSRMDVVSRTYRLDARHETLEERLERIARHTDLGMALVMTPELRAEDGPELRPALVGTALELIEASVQIDGLSLAGVGRDVEGGGAAVLVVDRRGRARLESGFQRLEELCLDVHRGGPQSRAASLTLASTGWPAGLAWLESLALHAAPSPGGDAALEGLLAAARQGLVVPGLTRADVRRTLLQRGELWLASPDPAVRRKGEGLARALAELGPRAPDGAECGSILLDGWDASTSDESVWLRLVALEGQRSAAPGLPSRVAAVATDAARPPSLRLQALRAYAASGVDPLELADPRGLGRLRTYAAARRGEVELLSLLGSVALPPDATLLEALGSTTDPHMPAFVARWALRSGGPAGAESLLRDAAADGMRRSTTFELWLEVARDARLVLGDTAARSLLDGALVDADSQLLRDLVVRAGLCSAEEQAQWTTELAEREELDGRALISFGALASGPLGKTVRERLIVELERAGTRTTRDLAEACIVAAQVLRAARRDAELRGLQREIWKGVRSPAHPLHELLGPDYYPPPVRVVSEDLGRFVRRLDS